MPRCTKPRSSRCIGADGRWPSDSISSTVQRDMRSWHHRVRRSLLHAMSARASIQLPSTMNHPAGEPWSSRAYEMNTRHLLYRSRTRHRDCDLRFGRMSRLRQDRGLCPFAFST